MLCACGSKKITWEDVEEAYTATQDSIYEKVNSLEEIYKDDYLKLTDYIRDNYGNVIFNEKADGKDYIELYAKALELRALSSINNSTYANELVVYGDEVISLIKASLISSEEVETIKQKLLDTTADIYTWEEKIWHQLEKRNYIKWSEVEKQYNFIDENFKNDMLSNLEVSEADLENLKKTIVNNYEDIKYGITASNNDTAKEVYTAAKKLWWYTKFIYSDNADKVFYFADKTIDFVKSQYSGYVSEHEAYDYEEEITAAKKYTQSIFNEIAILLKSN